MAELAPVDGTLLPRGLAVVHRPKIVDTEHLPNRQRVVLAVKKIVKMILQLQRVVAGEVVGPLALLSAKSEASLLRLHPAEGALVHAVSPGEELRTRDGRLEVALVSVEVHSVVEAQFACLRLVGNLTFYYLVEVVVVESALQGHEEAVVVASVQAPFDFVVTHWVLFFVKFNSDCFL